jgi:hypothetical protein
MTGIGIAEVTLQVTARAKDKRAGAKYTNTEYNFYILQNKDENIRLIHIYKEFREYS